MTNTSGKLSTLIYLEYTDEQRVLCLDLVAKISSHYFKYKYRIIVKYMVLYIVY